MIDVFPIVNFPSVTPFQEIKSLAVAIVGSKVTRNQTQRHVGLFFRPDGEDLQLIHFGWHDYLTCEGGENPDYSWIAPSNHINPVVLDTIADWLSVVWRSNRQIIPYSIKSNDSPPFDSKGAGLPRLS